MSRSTKHSDKQKEEALALAEEVTIREAAERTGVPAGTIKRWRFEEKTEPNKKPTKKANRTPKSKSKRTEPKETPRVGAPTSYKEEYAVLGYNYCLLGATDEDLARYFEVGHATISNWKNKHPKFLEALKKGKAEADAVVAEKLYHRAKGYSHPEDKIFNNNGTPLVVPTIKHYPPDTTAAIFWLKNRQPDQWRDKREVEHGGSVEKRYVYEITQRLIKDTEALDLADQLLQRSRAIPSINTGKPGGNGHRG
jgi:hypothetical protein